MRNGTAHAYRLVEIVERKTLEMEGDMHGYIDLNCQLFGIQPSEIESERISPLFLCDGKRLQPIRNKKAQVRSLKFTVFFPFILSFKFALCQNIYTYGHRKKFSVIHPKPDKKP